MGRKIGYAKTDDADFSNISCSCGHHYGAGSWSAEHRASVYAWFRDYYPSGYRDEHRSFLADWQRHHGYQEPNMHPRMIIIDGKSAINPRWRP